MELICALILLVLVALWVNFNQFAKDWRIEQKQKAAERDRYQDEVIPALLQQMQETTKKIAFIEKVILPQPINSNGKANETERRQT